ncbi:MAG: outer membrane protein assembly factor BamA [Sulfurospirillum sp.]|nr:outer membrane protein assembly factor BamA [Sulfurospirillum sp.]MBL0702769.1 outer membrane protein assembly factor BamA [Sulfurospirillum sp.]
MNRLLILMILIVSFLQATVVKSLKFDGMIHLSEEVASEMVGIKEGDLVDIEIIDEAVKVFYKQGYFEDIWVEEISKGEIVFYFKEKPTVAKIELEGIGKNDKEKVLNFLGIKKGEVYDTQKAALSELRVNKFYEAQGYFDTVVEHVTENLSENSIKITFLINRGEKVFIKSIEMCGVENLEYSDFEPKIANKRAEILPWMWGFNDGKLKLSDLPHDSLRIKDTYMEHGYLDAEISEPFLKTYMDNYEATLTYSVDEGKQYKIGLVDIKMPKGLIELDGLKKEMVLQSGDVFDVNLLRSDIKRVETAVADLGYAYVRVVPDINKKTKDAIADIYLRIIPGDKVYINDVRISGNSRTIDRVIRRDVFLASGDLYNRTDLRDTKGALDRSSYFDRVNIVEERVSRDKIDLVVEVTESSTGNIGGGIGYGSSDGVIFNFNLSDSNIFGSGMTASADVERSDIELDGRISLQNSRIFDSIYSVGGSVYRRQNDYNTDTITTEYDATTTGFSVNVGRRFGRLWGASLWYLLEDKEYDYFDDDKYNLYPSIVKSSIAPSIRYNNTDSYQLARKGISFNSSIEYAGIGGDAEFIESVSKLNFYHSFRDSLNYDLIFRYKSQFYYLLDNGFIPIDDYLTMGGVSTVRGYHSGSIGPTANYLDSNGNTILGSDGRQLSYYVGNAMLVNTIEASFPLIERFKMRVAVFLDYGMIGKDSLSDEIRAGTGAVFEWISPVGPISLIFAKPLLEKEYDRTANFEFTMGRGF